MMNFPQKFLDEMKELLGEEYSSFLESYVKPMNYGLRVNTLKISPEDYLALTGEELKRVPWTDCGFYYNGSQSYSKNPFYQAGLYYIQEPSAMRPAQLLPVTPGDRVLDLCAAPGGKSTALGAKLAGTGLLVANDVSASRAKALLKNIEYFGIRNSLVLSESSKKLARTFPTYFDKVLVDAPCSGEGMFRRKPSMVENWEKFGPEYFSPMQREILLDGADMLKPGGYLVYSTCTFSKLEDEGSVDYLLENRQDMECLKVERYWPHQVSGEGHFCALFHKKESAKQCSFATLPFDFSRHQKKEIEAFREFIQDAGITVEFAKERLVEQKGSLFYLPEEMPDYQGLRVIRSGWYLGELKKNRFEPSGAFARALLKDQCTNCLDLSSKDPRVIKYLKCETLVLNETDLEKMDIPAHEKKKESQKDWCLVTLCGYPLGFGKVNQLILKNKYPAGWRWE